MLDHERCVRREKSRNRAARRGPAGGPVQPPRGSFELRLTGPAVWLLAGGVAALLYQVAARLGG
ncbi:MULTISPECIES: hypothetical protein [Sorangium]|uniref:hypothetical protein n=1 Tax=Sorangium TaxID=39643 RepID=UPI003D9C508B